LYKAAAGIPGVTITDKAATLDGRTGIAFGRDESNGVICGSLGKPVGGAGSGQCQG
jgi:hypothetical protein